MAHELAKRGRTLVVDADPQGSLLAWSVQAEGFDFPVVALAVEDLHKRIKQLEQGYDHVVIDTPPGHIKIVRSALLAADVVVLPLGPTLVEIDRLRPTLELMADVEGLNEFDVRILFTRVKRGTNSAKAARTFLSEHMGLPLLESEIPLWEKYAQAFGSPPEDSFEYANVLREIMGEEILVDPKRQDPIPGPNEEEPAGELETPEAQELAKLFEEAGVKVVRKGAGPTVDDEEAADELSHEPVSEATEPLAQHEHQPLDEIAAVGDDVKHDGHEAIDRLTSDRHGPLNEPLPQAPLETPEPELPEPVVMPSAEEQEEGSPRPELSDLEAQEIAAELDAEEADPARGVDGLELADDDLADDDLRLLELSGRADEAEDALEATAPLHKGSTAGTDELLSVATVARLLDRSEVYVEELVAMGTLPADAEGLIPRADLGDWYRRRFDAELPTIAPSTGAGIGHEEPEEQGELEESGAAAEAPLGADDTASNSSSNSSAPSNDFSDPLSETVACSPYHYWLPDVDQRELGSDGIERHLHRCANCGLEVMAQTFEEATALADSAAAATAGEGSRSEA